MKKSRQTKSNDLSRREFLVRSGVSLTLAAGASLAPFVLSGCGGGKGTEAKNAAREIKNPGLNGDSVKVGILHSQTGTMAISEKSLIDAEKMAIDEINADGGVKIGDKKFKIVTQVEDPQSKFTDVFPEKARKLLLEDKVAVVFGCWTSSSRVNVKPVFEENDGLLFYPVQYEGNECSPNIVYTGAAPNQQIIPAVDWLLDEVKTRTKKEYKDQKWFLIGSNYIFPQTANRIIVEYLKKKKGLTIDTKQHEVYTKMGETEYSTVVQQIQKYGPDLVFSTINGDSNLAFYKEMKDRGLTADKCPICAVSVGEDELRGLDPDVVKGHFAAWNYYQSIETPANKKFVENFKKKYGAERVTDDPIEAAYFQVYFWKLAVEKAGATDPWKVREAFKSNIEFEAPGGLVKLDPETQHTWKYFRMGKIRGDKQFDIVYETKIIKPEPYPQEVFPGWSCDWVKNKDGVTKGDPVKIGN